MTEIKPQFSPLYAGYYNLIYRTKNYLEEAQFVLDRAKANGFTKPSGSILDLGSGTGRHALEFQKAGHTIHGVDLSESMVEVARTAAAAAGLNESLARFESGDIRTLSLGKKFDLAVSLFHVMSYQASDEDIRSTLKSVRQHLASGGLFIFDFWYGPTVLNLKPQERLLELRDEEFEVSRKTYPEHYPEQNLVSVRFELTVRESKSGVKEHFLENHRMRYLFIPELEQFLSEAGFKLRESGEWLTGNELGTTTWNGYAVAEALPEGT